MGERVHTIPVGGVGKTKRKKLKVQFGCIDQSPSLCSSDSEIKPANQEWEHRWPGILQLGALGYADRGEMSYSSRERGQRSSHEEL